MGLVPAICTQCGAKIEVDKGQTAGKCKFCGMEFITDKVVNNYYVIKSVSEKDNKVSSEVEKLLAKAENERAACNVKEAYRCCVKALELDPKSSEALVSKGILSCLCNIKEFESREITGCFNQAFLYKRELVGTGEQYVDFVEDSFNKLFVLGMTLYQAVVLTYESNWEDERSARTMWEQMEVLCNIFYIITDYAVKPEFDNSEVVQTIYKNTLKCICWCCVQICKQRKYKESGMTGNTKLLPQLHKVYMNKYDETMEKLQVIEPGYVHPETVNRNMQLVNNGCYIATCVYGTYDCPEVWVLRRYRDYTLDETWYGRCFIKVYYALSPTLVKLFGNYKPFKKFWKSRLDLLVNKLKEQGINDTSYNDKY